MIESGWVGRWGQRGGDTEVAAGEYFLVFVSGGLARFIFFPPCDSGNEVTPLCIVAFSTLKN